MSHVLIVDDKEQNVYFLKALLEANGYTVDSAAHGAAALLLARRKAPDLVISDLLMPVMDGYTLLRRWRVDPDLKSIPFIVYTATYTEPEDERLALALGADAFILKPQEPDDFMARVHEVEERRREGNEQGREAPRDGEDPELMKVYSEALIRKLEEKSLQLEEINRRLENDIEERKEIEQSLRESEERFRQLAENINEVFWMSNPDKSEILYVSPAYDEIWGRSSEHLYESPKDWLDAIHPDDRAAVERAAVTDQVGGGYSVTYRIIRPDGSLRWIRDQAFPVMDKFGQVYRIVGTASDITEAKVMEQQFLRAQRMESIGTLAGGIAHDLNNLLSPILIGVDLLTKTVDDPNAVALIETIRQSARRGSDLVKQVLSFARGVDGSRVVVQVGYLIDELGSIIANSFPKTIEFKKSVPRNLQPVLGDPTQLNQVLLNLCVNARDAMQSGGVLSLGVRNVDIDDRYAAMDGGISAGAYVMIEVADTGVGMSKEIQERIFEPFFTTKELHQGTGLGLSSVLGIIRSHGGFVNVESEVGKGSTFSVYLPVLDGVSAEVAPVASGSDPELLPKGSGECILVVDDEVSVLTITQQTLESFGYAVVTAEDGAQAVARYVEKRGEIALVLIDMVMPVMDGPSCVSVLQRLNPEVCVVAASGLTPNADPKRMRDLGVKHFLPKPYSADDLLQMVRRALP